MAKDMYQKRKERQENKSNEVYEKKKTNINWYPGHMAKTKREIKGMIDLIDIVYEIVDARIPISSKIVDINNLIKNKPKIMIMSKYDLCDKEKTIGFINYYENMGYKVITSNIQTLDVNSLINITKEVTNDIQIKRNNKGLKDKKIKALVIGIPNVGKSTLINKIAGKKVSDTGNKPGVTKSLKWIRISNDIELLDTPGILWPKFDNSETMYKLGILTAIKEEIIPKEEIVDYILKTLLQKYPKVLKEKYNLDDYSTDEYENYINIIGKLKGCLKKGGIVDEDRVVDLIINDFKQEKIKGITFD